jgi:mxaJ protein
MRSHSLLLALAATLATMVSVSSPANTLKVCADPDYLPFSNRAGRGFENEVAEAVAKYLGDSVEYTWWSYRGNGGFDEFLSRTLNAGRCDLVMSLPYGSGEALTTAPYYISSYVFVFQRDKKYDLLSMDSPILRQVKLGFEQETPPEDGLKLRGLIEGATPFDVSVHENESPRDMLDAVRDGRVDVMITWEPAVGSFLPDYPDLKVVPVPNERALGSPERYSFPMSMALRPNEMALAQRINAVIQDHKAELRTILEHHGVRLYKPMIEPLGPSDL